MTPRKKPGSAPQLCALTAAAVAQSPVTPPAEEHHRKSFPGTALGMALLPLTNGVHMCSLFIPRSLILPFPPKPGQVCSWVHLVSPGWLFVPGPAVLEGLAGSKAAQGTFRVSPVQRAAPSGTFPPPQQCQQGRRCEGGQGWGSQRAPESAPASLGAVGGHRR